MRLLKHFLALMMVVSVAVVLPGCATTQPNTHTMAMHNQSDNRCENRTNTAAIFGFGIGAAIGVGLVAMALIGLPAAVASGFCVG